MMSGTMPSSTHLAASSRTLHLPYPSGGAPQAIAMIRASKAGFLFRTTDQIRRDYPDIPAFEDYADLTAAIRGVIAAG